MEIDVVDYLVELNPYEPIWSLPHGEMGVSGSGPPCMPSPPWIGSPSINIVSGPSMPYQSFSALSADSPGLDYPPLSPTTLNHWVSFIAPVRA